MASNGRLTDRELAPIAGGRLAHGAAAAFNAMNVAARRQGVELRPGGPDSSYRSIERQWYYWNLWQSGRGNLAAYPGTSNHGWGLAVDLATQEMRAVLDRVGRPYGWAKEWSDAAGEWWHLKHRAGVWSGRDPGPGGDPYPTLRRGDEGAAVARAQKHLRRWNLGLTRPGVDGEYGTETQLAARQFQAAHGLKPDGVVGDRTWKELRRKDPLYGKEREAVNRARAYARLVREAHRAEIKESRRFIRRRLAALERAAPRRGEGREAYWRNKNRGKRRAVMLASLAGK